MGKLALIVEKVGEQNDGWSGSSSSYEDETLQLEKYNPKKGRID